MPPVSQGRTGRDTVVDFRAGGMFNREQGNANFYSRGGVTVTPEYIEIIEQGIRFGNRAPADRFIEMRLELSIEAGYLDKYDDGDIWIEVSFPAGFDRLVGSNRVTVLNVVDPIEVVYTAATDIINDQGGYTMGTIDVGDILITETDFGMLERGKELWVYVVGKDGRAADASFAFDSFEVANAMESGLDLRSDRSTRDWDVAGESREVQRFVITSESRDRNRDNEPGEILIRGGRIHGPIYEGVEYSIVVSGDAVAESAYGVFGARTRAASGGDLINNRWRLFDSTPYSVLVAEPAPVPVAPVVEDAPPPVVTEPEPPAAPAIVSTTHRFNVNTRMEINGQMMQPFKMVQVTPSLSAGFLSSRVVSMILGIEPQWDAATGTATFVGTHALSGLPVTVSVTTGESMAILNGNAIDIAANSGNYPAGTVITPYMADGFQYLPLRFLAETAFGLPVGWDPATATAIIN
jgi:hypothetical protein